MNDYQLRMKNFQGAGPFVVVVFRKYCDLGFQSLQIFFDKIARALVQDAVLTEREKIEVTSSLHESVSHDRSGRRLQDLFRLGLRPSSASRLHTMLALYDLDGKIVEIKLFAALNSS